MIEYITFILGIALGAYVYRTFFSKKKELTVDECMQLLKNKGYWVRVGPKDKD